MESSLFNPGFLGGTFYWFIGQVADDSTWRENQNPEKFDTTEEMPAWGYRYKVRIIGHHDQEESSVTAEQLPWAQVMYPVTAGTGHGGSFMTPAIRQGSFVFGFFLDGKDQQNPIIMGCLGNNAKTKLERKMGTEGSGGKNFTPVSFFSQMLNPEPNDQKKLKDADFAPGQAGNDAYNSPSDSNVSAESSDANNLYTVSDERTEYTLEENHTLACPNPDTQSDTKNIQTVIATLTEKIERFQQSLLDANKAGGLPILESNKDIDAAIESASEEIAKFMKGTMNKLQQFTTKEFNEKLASMENLAPPSHTLELLNKKVEGLEKIACMFNGMAGLALVGLIAAALKKAFNRKKKLSEQAAANTATSEAGVVGVSTGAVIPSVPTLDTPGSNQVPQPPSDGFYRPTPLCETEEIIGEVLGGTINTIMQGFNDAIGPVVDEIQNSLGGSSTETGDESGGVIDSSVSENNVLASLSSGDLVLSMTQTVAEKSGLNPNNIGGANRYWADGNYGRGLLSFLDAKNQNTLDNQELIAEALSLINDRSNPTGIAAGLALTSNLLGVNVNLLEGVGNAFEAIRTGEINLLVNAASSLASTNPRILKAIVGKGAAISGGIPSGLGLGALGGMNFDITSALGFVNSITKIFDCDPDPECSPNDTHSMQSGGGSSDNPNTSNVAESAKETSLSTKERKSYGTSTEKLSSSKEGVTIKKVFAKPRTREKDLTNLVGYVNGQPYYGPFHVHERDDGSIVKMVGIAHTTTPHDIIYDTVQESIQ
jgi:hypothetical protein